MLLLAGYEIGYSIHNELLGKFEWQELLWCDAITLAGGKHEINVNPLFSQRQMYVYNDMYYVRKPNVSNRMYE